MEILNLLDAYLKDDGECLQLWELERLNLLLNEYKKEQHIEQLKNIYEHIRKNIPGPEKVSWQSSEKEIIIIDENFESVSQISPEERRKADPRK